MSYTVFFEPNAITDIQEAVTYYDLKKDGLGEVFYESIENAIETKKIHIISVFNTSKNPNTYYDL